MMTRPLIAALTFIAVCAMGYVIALCWGFHFGTGEAGGCALVTFAVASTSFLFVMFAKEAE